jgi:hypothetical protein
MGQMDWLWGAIAGAVATAICGALGFLFNIFVLEPRSRLRDAQQHSLEALRELQYLLAISSDAFRNQNFKAQTLLGSIRRNHPEVAIFDSSAKSLGYDEVFHKSYHSLSAEEMPLFLLIRGTTMTTLHDTNSKMQKWIEDHSEFVVGAQPNEARSRLRQDLVLLRTHLGEWLAKYVVWIPGDETRAIVYLADEKGHGPPFPKSVEASLEVALLTLGGSS